MDDDRYVAGIMCVRTGEWMLNRFRRQGHVAPLVEPLYKATVRSIGWARHNEIDTRIPWEPFVVHVTDAERLK